jgi:hypothetical protein
MIMTTKNTIMNFEDQIKYLETYSNMLKAQQEMIDMQVQFLKAGKDIQKNMMNMSNMFFNMPFNSWGNNENNKS